MGYLADSYRELSPMKTDFYQLTMAKGYFDEGRKDEEATFYMHWRMPPFDGGYTVAAGLEGVVDFLKNFKFTDERIAYLRSQERDGKRLFSEEFLNYLQKTPLKLDVQGVPEGTVMTGQGPVIRVTGSLVQAQLVESAILNIVNSASIVATRAARLDEAAKGRPFADFSLRRSPDLSTSVARSAFIGGASHTADADASMRLGIPVTGTMAHAWIMGHKAAVAGYIEAKKAGRGERWVSPYIESVNREFYENLVRSAVDTVWPNVSNSEIELVGFKAYLKSMPTNSVLLIDTYNPVHGMKNAIRAAIETGTKLNGIRLDSGDLYELAWTGKELLDEARKTHPDLFANSKIFATDGLDEQKIEEMQERSLRERGAELPIDVYGVGTELGNPGPLRGGVYKVTANEIIREDFEASLDTKGNPKETVKVGSEIIPIIRDSVGTMKIAGVNKVDPSLPGPKSSMPGAGLDTMRLKDKDGKIIADVIVDMHKRPSKNDWADILENVVDAAGNKVDMNNVASTEMLLKPIFERKNGQSNYVYDAHGAPGTRPAFVGSAQQVTDLDQIKAYCREQRASLPEGIRRNTKPHIQPILMDRLVCEERQAIFADSQKEIPGAMITGDLSGTNGISLIR